MPAPPDPSARITVAELDGRLTGYALVLFRPGTRPLYSIAVAPEARFGDG
jgi:hypothetical protein